MKTLIKNVTIIKDGQDKVEGSLLVEDGYIKGINLIEEADEIVDGQGLLLMPGMIDIHLHGSYGHDFIRNPKEAVAAVSKGLVKEGTTAYLASLTVIPHDALLDLLKEYATVENEAYTARFLGVHSEGPYLSKEYKALMKEEWIQKANIKDFEALKEAGKGVLKVMTIAPEQEGAMEVIKQAGDVIMMIGHSATDYKTAKEAISNGVLGFTHLYNAMSQHNHRKPGAVTAAFDSDCFKEMIVDGFHTNEAIVKTSFKIFGPNEIILITDAMIAKGMEDGIYHFSELNCQKHGNTVQVIETGRIAGSCITQLEAIQYMKKFTDCSINDLVQMACVNPARLLKLDHEIGSIKEGLKADFLLIDEALQLHATYIDGKCVYKR